MHPCLVQPRLLQTEGDRCSRNSRRTPEHLSAQGGCSAVRAGTHAKAVHNVSEFVAKLACTERSYNCPPSSLTASCQLAITVRQLLHLPARVQRHDPSPVGMPYALLPIRHSMSHTWCMRSTASPTLSCRYKLGHPSRIQQSSCT